MLRTIFKESIIQSADTSERNQRIYDFLKSQPVGVLATVDPDNNPHAAVVYFSVDEKFNILFMTKRDTKKRDNLLHNNHAMLVAYEPIKQATVQVTGTVEEVQDNEEAQWAFSGMLSSSARTSEAVVPPLSKLYAGHYVAYKLKPVQIRMAMFIRPGPGGYDMYETIDF